MENLATLSRKTQALVVDDEKTARFILRQILEREGCSVIEAANGGLADELELAGFETGAAANGVEAVEHAGAGARPRGSSRLEGD